MRNLFVSILLLINLQIFAQDTQRNSVLFDTTLKSSDSRTNFYSNTDFLHFKDPVNWFYEIQLYNQFTNKISDSLSLGIIKLKKYFNLTMHDSKQVLTEFNFDIYNISDSIHCQSESKKIKMLSSCIPPNVGGDYIEFGSFILLNRNVCLQCKEYNNTDFCRPEINQILLIANNKGITNIDDLENSLQFALGVIEKRYWQKQKK